MFRQFWNWYKSLGERGEVNPNPNPDPNPNPNPNPDPAASAVDFSKLSASDILKGVGGWHNLIPGDFKVDGKPAKEVPFFTDAKDWPDFLKRSFDAHKEFGSRIKIPGKDAKPEEKKAFVDKIREAGIFVTKPYPESPDKYEVKPPDDFGELDKDVVGKALKIAHKHEIPQEAMTELMGVYFEHHADIMPVLTELKELVPALKQTKEEGLKAFEEAVRESGQDTEGAKAAIARYVQKRFSKEQVDLMGDYGSNPIVLQMMYENAMASGEDSGPLNASSEIKSTTEGEEADAIMFDASNPKNAIWKARTPEGEKMRNYVLELRKKAYEKGGGA